MKIQNICSNIKNIYIYLLCVLNLALICCSLNITVLHNNDFHTHYEAINVWGSECKPKNREQCYGGIARTVTKVKEILRQENTKNVLFLNGGDHFQGTIWYTFMKWKVVSKFVKLFNHDVMALGNHEFDDGVEGLIPFIRNVSQNNDKNLPIVCSNIETSGELKRLVKPSIVVEREGRKIAIIGYITPETSFLARPGSTVKFNDEIESIQKEIENLKLKYKKDLNIFIAVGHSGFEKDKEIAQRIPDLDIVVGGHTNTFLYTGDKPSIEEPEGEYPVVFDHGVKGKTLVVQAYAYGKYLGKLDVVFNEKGFITKYSGNPILLDETTAEDPQVLAEVKEIGTEINEYYKEVIGSSYSRLEATSCRQRECNFGNLFADSYVASFLKPTLSKSWNSVAIGIANGGSVRSGVSAGNITMKDIVSSSPFGNKLGILKVNGESLWQILQHSADQYRLGGFLQVSGIRYTINTSLPLGERLISVRVRCSDCSVPAYEDLSLSKTYLIAITEYLVNGGDNYTMINKSDFIAQQMLDYDVLSTYVGKYSPIYPGVEDRIIDLNPEPPIISTTSPSTVQSSLNLPTPTKPGQNKAFINYTNNFILVLICLLFFVNIF